MEKKSLGEILKETMEKMNLEKVKNVKEQKQDSVISSKDKHDEIKKNDKIITWKDKHVEIKRHKAYDKSFSWSHAVIGKNKETEELVLRLIRPRSWFSMKSKKHYDAVINILNKAASDLGWIGGISSEEIDTLTKQSEEVLIWKESSNKKGELRDEKFKLNLDDFKKDVSDLKLLLKNESKEKKIQDWLYNHTWVFGPTYIDTSKEELNRKGDRIDFLLQRYDTFYDIIELKLPSAQLFIGEKEENIQNDISRKHPMSADLKNSISQVIEYLEEYELDKTNIKWKREISIHKPKAIIVIGRREKDEKRAVKTLQSYLRGIEILTYDDIINRANNFIKIIEEKNK